MKFPIHFFTIVLNGEPFIRHHIDVFNRLPFPWRWHIIEGVADLVRDTAWSIPGGGKITSALHCNGLSNDGTTRYLDELAQRFPANVTIYRKAGGKFWDGKLEMVNSPLAGINEECLLWQVDSDELWETFQIITMRDMFLADSDKTAAFFCCHFHVGPDLVTTTVDTYGNNTSYEWLRCWRYKQGDIWKSHEPPALMRSDHNIPGIFHNVGQLNPFLHLETVKAGLVFRHYAYSLESQLVFKERYYGYSGAIAGWKHLQSQSNFPCLLRDFFPWVHDETKVERILDSTPLQLLPRSQGAGQSLIYLRTDAIGDNVLSAGMLPHIRKRYPGATLTLVCQDRVASLYDACPYADSVISFNYKGFMTNRDYRDMIVNKINLTNPTLILNPIFSHDLHDEFLAHHVNAPFKITCQGDASNRDQEKLDQFSFLYSRVLSNDPADVTELDRNRTFLRGLGIDAADIMPQVWTSADDELWAEDLLNRCAIGNGNALMLFPGALLDCKTYPHYAEVVKTLHRYPLIVLGGEEVFQRGNELCEAHGGKTLNLAGQTTLSRMAALMRRGNLYLGSDSAGMHIACAVGLKNVVLLGGGHFGRFCPYSPLTTAVSLPLECYHCNWQCPWKLVHCLDAIRPQTVLDAIHHALAHNSSLPQVFLQQSSDHRDSPSILAADKITGFLKCGSSQLHSA